MVVLAVVVVVLCTAVFILLRDHSQSDEERRARRHRHTQLPASAYDFKYRAATDMSTTTPSPSVLDRIRRLIQGRKRNQEATRMRGFVQAAGDEWDDDMSDLRHNGKDTAYDGTPRAKHLSLMSFTAITHGQCTVRGGPLHHSAANQCTSHLETCSLLVKLKCSASEGAYQLQ